MVTPFACNYSKCRDFQKDMGHVCVQWVKAYDVQLEIVWEQRGKSRDCDPTDLWLSIQELDKKTAL